MVCSFSIATSRQICNQRLERVSGTEYAHILRVLFRSEKGILRKWILRFDVWPFLETYTEVLHSFEFLQTMPPKNSKKKSCRKGYISTQYEVTQPQPTQLQPIP